MKFGHLRETDNAAGSGKPEGVIAGAGVAFLRKQQPANAALLNSLWGREKLKFGHLRKTKDLAPTSREPQDLGGRLISLFSHFLLKKTPVRAPSQGLNRPHTL
jgi:hypothetical protein